MEKSLAFLETNPHLIATSYLKQAQEQINKLVIKASSSETTKNSAMIREIKE
jgi:hypothetical protein